MAEPASPAHPGSHPAPVRRVASASAFAGRYLTASYRPLPHFVILGAQRGGTTSLYRWLSSHPDVAPALKKEVHFFDGHYDKGIRWYRAHFALGHRGRISGESCPYLLFHPLAPGRVARDLPATARFVVLLREPAERAISQYWHWRQQGRWETESLERAIELEDERLAPQTERFLRGERSVEHIAFSYVARGEYAGQLRRWFDAVGQERILVLESEQLAADPAVPDQVLDWLGLPPHHQPYPASNAARRLEPTSPELLGRLRDHFRPHNQALFELLGRELWTDLPGVPSADRTTG